MSSCLLHFHGHLTAFAATADNGGRIDYPLTRRASIKDIVEALGPPHTEVGSILAHGQEVGFDYIPVPGEQIDLHPLYPPVDPCIPSRLRPHPLPAIRFVADVNVGKLGKLLRMLGFDTAYHWSWRDAWIAEMAGREQRIALSKDHALLKRSSIEWGRLIRAEQPQDQLQEVLTLFGLKPPFALFSRCLVCNSPLRPVSKQEVLHRLEPKTKRYFHRFHVCPTCERIYWQGSHHDRMQDWLRDVLPQLEE